MNAKFIRFIANDLGFNEKEFLNFVNEFVESNSINFSELTNEQVGKLVFKFQNRSKGIE